jgi:hypothetical protein
MPPLHELLNLSFHWRSGKHSGHLIPLSRRRQPTPDHPRRDQFEYRAANITAEASLGGGPSTNEGSYSIDIF